MKNAVSVIIPVWNGRNLLEKHLPFLMEAARYKKNRIFEVIIVDDKSTDDSVNFVKKNYPTIKLVKHTKNRGFSATVNTGARAAKGEVLCLLNQDVSPGEAFLEHVLPHFKKEGVFAVSLHEKGYGYAIGKFENGFIGHRGGPEKDKTTETFWVNGGSGVFKRDIWMKLGGLDEKLLSPFYWEDLDLGYRAMKRGYKLLWEPRSMIYHNHESSINVSNFRRAKLNLIKERNQLLVTWKNITSPRLFKKHIRGLTSRIVRHPGYLRIFLVSFVRLGDVLKARAKEKRESTISDETIFAKFENQ